MNIVADLLTWLVILRQHPDHTVPPAPARSPLSVSLSPGPGESVAPWQRAPASPAGDSSFEAGVDGGRYRFQFAFAVSVRPGSSPLPAPFSLPIWLTHSDLRLNTRCRANIIHRPPAPTPTSTKAGHLHSLFYVTHSGSLSLIEP